MINDRNYQLVYVGYSNYTRYFGNGWYFFIINVLTGTKNSMNTKIFP